MTVIKETPTHPLQLTAARLHPILRLLVIVSLVIFALFVVDLALHPLSPSEGPTLVGDQGVTFRYFSILAGTLNVWVGLLVLRKSPGNSLSVLLLVWGASAAGWSVRSDYSTLQITGWVFLLYYIFFFGFAWPAIVAFLYMYPTGKIYPAWSRPLILAAIGVQSALGVTANLALPAFGAAGLIPNPIQIPWLQGNLVLLGNLFGVVSLLAIFGPLVSLVARFRRAEWLERQQIKWLVWLVAVAAVLTAAPSVFSDSQDFVQNTPPLQQILSFATFILYQSLAALASGIAIVRYRLWDIDVIIRRTLVYSLLSGLLGLTFFGSVTLLQSLFSAVSGQQSPAALVLSTLAIAGLFNTLRRRVQDFIDRRFYRRKYDAEKALADFAAAARSEADLAMLSARLTSTVQETLQPERVTLWLVND